MSLNASIDWYIVGEVVWKRVLNDLVWLHCMLELNPDRGVEGGIAWTGITAGVGGLAKTCCDIVLVSVLV